MSLATPQTLATLVGALADRQDRFAAAAALAKQVGARALVILLRDPELGSLRPAPGFAQTLPGGPTWAELLGRCDKPGRFETQVAFPDTEHFDKARVWVGPGGEAVLLIGGSPGMAVEDLANASRVLLALLRAEAQAEAATAQARAAGDVTRRATTLAASLDGARAQLAANARALSDALADAARLNAQLKTLNDTLEQRVREETAERVKAQDALRQAQKMEAIGQLTGGVAHDFNNLLTVIMGGLDTVRRQLDGPAESHDAARLRRACDMADQAANRAAVLTARLLAFARRQALDPKPLLPDRLVRGLGDILQRTLGETVTLETVGTPGQWAALADPNELEAALVNLAVNARDAMPNGGKLTIETANVWLDEAYLEAVVEPAAAGQYVMIAVSDTGEGMDGDTLSHVFEPFFTTKEVGKGTGLGLSQVYGFVRQSEGLVRIYSEPGEGTTVKIYLPRLNAEVAEAAEAEPRRDLSLLRGAETVLVVEDDVGVRDFSTGVLRELGYAVLEAHDAASARAVLEAHRDIDLLFTDVVLPGGVHGRQLAEEVRKARPRVRVLFTSGYTRNAIVHNGRLKAGVQLITKPFSYEDLALRVRQLLDGSPGGGGGARRERPPAAR